MISTSNRKGVWLIYTAYLLSFAVCFSKAENIFERSNSCDLLYRVIGSRLMKDGKSAYFYKWQPGEPDKYYHFRHRENQPINGVTVTPFMLRLNMVFAGDDFCLDAKEWLYIECGILFLTGFILLIAIPGFIPKAIVLVSFMLFFEFSRNFYTHLHVGQVYVLYGLIFCIYYLLLKSNYRYKFFLLGVLTLFAVWLRPLFFIVCIPFVLQKKRRPFVLGSVVTAVLLIMQVIFSGDMKYWKEYSSAMTIYAQVIPGTMEIMNPPSPLYFPSNSIDCVYPSISFDRYGADGLESVQYYMHNRGINIDKSWMFALAAFIIASLLSFAAVIKRKLSAEQFAVLLFLIYLVAELLIPAYRLPYYLIQWALPVVIILSHYRKNYIAATLMLTGIILNHFPIDLNYIEQVGELLMIAAGLYFVFKPVSDPPVLSSVSDE